MVFAFAFATAPVQAKPSFGHEHIAEGRALLLLQFHVARSCTDSMTAQARCRGMHRQQGCRTTSWVLLPAQVLSPMRKGPAGVANLNMRLQALLNPPGEGRAEIVIASGAAERPQILRVGDRILQAGAPDQVPPVPVQTAATLHRPLATAGSSPQS